jgi:biotin carboxyl carrier protein
MLPDAMGRVRIRANLSGEVEIRASVGQVVYSGQLLAIVEGDQEIESLSVRKPSRVEEIQVTTGTEVEAGALLMIVVEVDDGP